MANTYEIFVTLRKCPLAPTILLNVLGMTCERITLSRMAKTFSRRPFGDR